MKEILLASVCIFFTSLAYSQDSTITKKTNTTVIKDSRINQLNTTHASKYKLSGFRVQIYSGNKKQPANQARSIFLRSHPKTKAHLNYEQPYYKVRVGDFRTKLEALKYKNGLVQDFPNCFIVKDDIDIDEVK